MRLHPVHFAAHLGKVFPRKWLHLPILCPAAVLLRSDPSEFFENPAKMNGLLHAALPGDFLSGFVGFCQEILCAFHALPADFHNGGSSQRVFEMRDKRGAGNSGRF